MSRRVQLILLCEDSQHEAFARRFLERMGWNRRSIRVEKAPGGRGSGEQFVRARFPLELCEHRRRHAAQALVVMLDGDAGGVEARVRDLADACTAEGIPARRPGEPVAVFVPTWNIETWLAYLDGQTVDEARKDYPRLRRERECKRHVKVLVAMCREGRLRPPEPPSLASACKEYASRLREVGR